MAMATLFVTLFALIFPAMSFVVGIYLVYRGWKRKTSSSESSICGAAVCQNPYLSPLTNRRCIYAKASVMTYKGGPNPWRTLWTSEHKTPFTIGKTVILPEHAEYRVSDNQEFIGQFKRQKGLIEDFVDPIAKTLPGYHKEFLGESIQAALMSDPTIKKSVSSNISKVFKITESAIIEGTEVCVIDQSGSKNASHAGSSEYPLLVSDSGAQSASSVIKEKAIFGIGLGLTLILLSALVTAYILLYF